MRRSGLAALLHFIYTYTWSVILYFSACIPRVPVGGEGACCAIALPFALSRKRSDCKRGLDFCGVFSLGV